MPKVVVFRPLALPLIAPLARLADPAGALREAAHFVYASAAQDQARSLWAVAEPEAEPAVTADLLALGGAAAELFRDVIGVRADEALRFGFHGGLTPAEAAEAMTRDGFEVVPHGIAVGAAPDGAAAERAAAILFGGPAARGPAFDEARAFVAGDSAALTDLTPACRAALFDGHLGLYRFGAALFASTADPASFERVLDLHACIFPDGEWPRFTALQADRMPLSSIFHGLVRRGIGAAHILSQVAFSGFGPAGSACRGWLSAELLAASDTWLDELRGTDAEHVGDVVERLLLDSPAPLLGIRAVREGALRVAAEHLTPASLERLLDVGAIDAAGVAVAWTTRSAQRGAGDHAESSRIGAQATVRDLAGPMRVMRGGHFNPSWDGPGTSAATVLLQDCAAAEKRILRPTDVAWSRGGDRVLVVADQVRILRRRERATATFTEGIGGRASFEPLREVPLPRKRAKDSENVVLSARFDTRGRLVTGWRHGELRGGPADTDPAGHEPLARFDEPVFRVGIAPVGRALAVIVGTTLVLLPDGRTPRKLGPAWTGAEPGRTVSPGSHMAAYGVGAHLAWTPDGERLAVCCDGDLVIHDATGERVASCRVAGDFEAHGGVGASERGFFVLRANGLAWWTPEGALRELPRAVMPREGDLPGNAEVTPGGRAVVTWTMSSDDTPDRHAHLEVFDLDRGAAHLLHRYAWNHPVPLTAIAPTGDVVATANGLALRLDPWTLDHERDEVSEVLLLGRSLRKRGHLGEARKVLLTVSTRRGSLGLALREELDGIARDSKDAAPAPATPLPLAAPPVRPATKEDLDVNDAVIHARFGQGTVVDVEGRGGAARVTVDFAGTERMLPSSSLRRKS